MSVVGFLNLTGTMRNLFGHISRFTSVETIMYLIKSISMHVLIYGIEACSVYSSDIKTLDHHFYATFMEVFYTQLVDVVRRLSNCVSIRQFKGAHLSSKNKLCKQNISYPNSICSISKLC